MTAFDQIVNDWRTCRIKAPLTRCRQQKEHPNVQANNQHKLEHNFSNHVLAQIQRAINYNQEELNDQHEQEKYWNLVLFKVRQYTSVTTRLTL